MPVNNENRFKSYIIHSQKVLLTSPLPILILEQAASLSSPLMNSIQNFCNGNITLADENNEK